MRLGSTAPRGPPWLHQPLSAAGEARCDEQGSDRCGGVVHSYLPRPCLLLSPPGSREADGALGHVI
eukprot:3877912-Alexandrium_andersonii.AAC.1